MKYKILNHCRWQLAIVLFGMLTAFMSLPLYGQVLKGQEKALVEAFADTDTVHRETLFLDDEQQKSIESTAKMPLNTGIISYYVGIKAGKPYRYVFFEDQIVRTKKAVLMVVVNANQRIEQMEVLAFYEPKDYLPIDRWFNLFNGKSLTDGILPGRDIDGVTGATLSVRVFSGIARRTLAILSQIREQ